MLVRSFTRSAISGPRPEERERTDEWLSICRYVAAELGSLWVRKFYFEFARKIAKWIEFVIRVKISQTVRAISRTGFIAVRPERMYTYCSDSVPSFKFPG